MAHRSKKFTIEVLRSSMAFLRREHVRRRHLGDGRRDDRRGRQHQHVEIGEPRIHRARSGAARSLHHLDIVGGRDVARRARCRTRTFGSMPAPRRSSRSRWMAKASAGAKPPLALTCAMSSSSGSFSLRQPRAGLLQPVERVAESASPTVSSRFSSGRPCAMPSAGRRAAPARAARSPRPPSPRRPWRSRRRCAPSARSSRA